MKTRAKLSEGRKDENKTSKKAQRTLISQQSDDAREYVFALRP